MPQHANKHTCTGSITQHTVSSNTHMAPSHMTQAQHSHIQHELISTCIHKHKDVSDEASFLCKAHRGWENYRIFQKYHKCIPPNPSHMNCESHHEFN